MLIALVKKEENIVEYVLYMWQIEDILRANNMEISSIEKLVISQYNVEADTQLAIRDWYIDLISKMKEQGKVNKGHLFEIHEVIHELNFLHNTLLNLTKDKQYNALYEEAEPNIDLLRKKSPETAMNIIETCLNGVYGVLILRLKKQAITPDTQAAVESISRLLALLALNYKQIKNKQ